MSFEFDRLERNNNHILFNNTTEESFTIHNLESIIEAVSKYGVEIESINLWISKEELIEYLEDVELELEEKDIYFLKQYMEFTEDEIEMVDFTEE